MQEHINNTFLPIQNKLVNYALIIFSIIGIIIFPFTIFRNINHLSQENIILGLITLCVVIAAYFRHRISINYKIIVICSLGLLLVINGLLANGFLATSKIYICIVPIFISFILPQKKSILVLLLFFITISIFAFLYSYGYLKHNFELNEYVTKPQVWIVDGLILFMAGLSILLVGQSYHNTIKKNLDDIKLKNDDLVNKEKKYRTLFESSNDAIIIISENEIIDCNQSALNLYKCDKNYLLYASSLILSPKSQPNGKAIAKKMDSIFSKILKGIEGPHEIIECQRIKSNGEIFYSSVSINGVNINDLYSIQLTERDITEKIKIDLELEAHRKNLENLVYERTKELEISLEREKELGILKTNFVTMASHEFRTPLATIKSATEVILRYSDKLSEKDINKRLFKIKNEVDDMTEILQDILIIGKGYSDKLKYNPTQIEFISVVKNILSDTQLTKIEPREIEFQLSHSSIVMQGDEKHIKHIINNLPVRIFFPGCRIHTSLLSSPFANSSCFQESGSQAISITGIFFLINCYLLFFQIDN